MSGNRHTRAVEVEQMITWGSSARAVQGNIPCLVEVTEAEALDGASLGGAQRGLECNVALLQAPQGQGLTLHQRCLISST